MPQKHTITASEIGTYVFCPRARALQKRGYRSENRQAMQEGSDHHRNFGVRDRAVRILQVLLILVMLCALYFLIRGILQ